MDKSAVFSWRASASTIALVCGAAVGAAGSALWTRLHDNPAGRPPQMRPWTW